MATKNKPMSLREQENWIRHSFPGFKVGVKNNLLVAEGDLQPSAITENYRVEVRYRLGDPPGVSVLSPELKNRPDGESPPHMYVGDKLCLYLPSANEWTPQKALAATIIPWASEWLLNYELWLVTGEWLGGGVHLPRKQTPRRELNERAKRILVQGLKP